MRTLIFIVSTLSIFIGSVKANELVLGYPEFKPYTFTRNSVPAGEGTEWIRVLTGAIKQKVKYVPVLNYGQGVQLLQQGKIDGLFLASQNEDRNRIAQFSEAITVNRWNWFFRKDQKPELRSASAKKNLKVVSHKGANTHKWLLKQGYESVYPTHDVQAMIRQLMAGRVDAVFLAERVFLDELNKSKWSLEDIEFDIEIAKPFGIYISHAYLASNPEFMSKLNAQIKRLSLN